MVGSELKAIVGKIASVSKVAATCRNQIDPRETKNGSRQEHSCVVGWFSRRRLFYVKQETLKLRKVAPSSIRCARFVAYYRFIYANNWGS